MTTAAEIKVRLGGRPDDKKVRCPVHDDRNPSLEVWDFNGRPCAKCWAGCPKDKVYAALGLDLPSGQFEYVAPVPADAPKPTFRHYKHGQPVETWAYRDAHGNVLFHTARFELSPTEKEVLPHTLWRNSSGGLVWKWKATPAPRPLYGLDRLASRPEAPVLVTEGEKCADAATRCFPEMVVVTSQGGHAAAKQSEWEPLRGRPVTVWPDADVPGERYAHDVARLAQSAGAHGVWVIPIPSGKAKGWDVADAAKEGWTLEDFQKFFEAAPEWKPPPGEKELPRPSPEGGARPPEFSDAALALNFGERHGHDLLYVSAWKRWLRWIGSHWAADETLLAADLARRVCSERAAVLLENGNSPAQARSVASAKTISGVERLARALPAHAATSAQFNSDFWAFNAPDGTADLEEK